MSFDAGTAGSTTLILQSLMPVMAFCPNRVEVELRGGTNNPMAPPIEYFQHVLLPVISSMGYKGRVELLRRGFYPRGQGVVKAYSEPVRVLKPLRLVSFGGVKKIRGLAYSCRLPSHIVERMAKKAKEMLAEEGYSDVEIGKEVLNPGDARCSVDPGTGIMLMAELKDGPMFAADALGERGVPAERVAENAVKELVSQLQRRAPVDKHLGDQLIVWSALANGTSEYVTSELTLHAVTMIELVKKIIGAELHIKGNLGGVATIRCDGIGLENRFFKNHIQF